MRVAQDLRSRIRATNVFPEVSVSYISYCFVHLVEVQHPTKRSFVWRSIFCNFHSNIRIVPWLVVIELLVFHTSVMSSSRKRRISYKFERAPDILFPVWLNSQDIFVVILVRISSAFIVMNSSLIPKTFFHLIGRPWKVPPGSHFFLSIRATKKPKVLNTELVLSYLTIKTVEPLNIREQILLNSLINLFMFGNFIHLSLFSPWQETIIFKRQIIEESVEKVPKIGKHQCKSTYSGDRECTSALFSFINRIVSNFNWQMDVPCSSENDIKVTVPSPTLYLSDQV